MAQVTSPQESHHHEAHSFRCPRTDDGIEAIFKDVRAQAVRFSLSSKTFFTENPDDAQAWLRSIMERTRHLFQPWCMEILFAAGIRDSVRFSELEQLLGISSKTLAAKLRVLTDGGFLVRTVHDTQPVSVDYRLTRMGKHTVTMAGPLFSFLHECEMSQPARDPGQNHPIG